VTNAQQRHVLVAPDKFKGTLTAAQAAGHIAAGLRGARPGLAVREIPVADGGDGTVAAAVAAGYQVIQLTVRGPAGQPVRAEYAWRGGIAIVETAQACGLTRLPGGRLQPLTATSYGVGELIAAAAARASRRIVLGLGGVASTDGGAGMMQALGARLLDRDGRELPPGGAALAGLDRLDTSGLHVPAAEVLIASDVNNPLLGPRGAAAVYGPQKGARASDIARLESGLARWADFSVRSTASLRPGPAAGPPGLSPAALPDQPGAGAAGGLGFAALAFLSARVQPGIELILDMIGFTAALAGARLVITGEGALDTQTLHGKAPAGVARAAAALAPGVPVIAMAGRRMLTDAELRQAGFAAAYALTDFEPDPARCMAQAGPLLEQAARRVAADWLCLPAGAAYPLARERRATGGRL
jgi:glycerate 2-kinase